MQEAIQHYQDAYQLDNTYRKADAAIDLNNIGLVYSDLGEKAKALEFYNQALPLRRETGDKRGEAATLNNLMYLWNDPIFSQRSSGMAVLCGKQSVNLYQFLREDAKKIGQQELASFTKTAESTYRTLADILIAQGRILEGQMVLDLLKQQELFDLLRRDAKELSAAKLAELNEIEAEADRRMKVQGDKILELAREEEALRKKPEGARTPQEKQRLVELKRLLDEAQAQFQKVLESLVALFEQNAARLAAKPFTPSDAEALTTTLKGLREQTRKKPVAVYTLVGENKLRCIVLSDLGNPIAREYPISAVDLNKKVAAFREALQNPQVDPRPLGKELYDILIKPIEADLNGAQAQTLLWSLDGTLRYIPFAALSPDGVHYLIETERSQSILPLPRSIPAR